MKVMIRARHIELTPELLRYCQRHLVDRLERVYDNGAMHLVIALNDSNGTKGGSDQECRLTCHLPRTRPIHVEEVSENIFKSLDRARDHMVRRIKSERQRMRQPGHSVAARPRTVPPPGWEWDLRR